MSQAVIVCGTWDKNGGKKSSVMESLIKGFRSAGLYDQVLTYNGGIYRAIQDLYIAKADVILWFPNIPNKFDKSAREIKKTFPRSILVTSKNNCEEVYSFQEIVAHALMLKSNLVLEVFKDEEKYVGQLLDPLGDIWCAATPHFDKLGKMIAKRTDYLRKITRKPTVGSPEEMNTGYLYDGGRLDFYRIIERAADTFHKLINPAKDVKRFLGNASFRCMNGFPSMRVPNGDIFVSKRNVDKRHVGPESFVQVGYNAEKDITWYRGENKPSVDAVIQLQLYRTFPRIKYMLHSHTYVERILSLARMVPFTETMVPCGGLEEVDEILKAIDYHKINSGQSFALNLIGHGSLICITELDDFKWFKHVRRPVPEILED